MNGAGQPGEDLVEAGVELVDRLDGEGITARLLGGVAIVLHCPSLEGRPHRPIEDIDLIVRSPDRRALTAAMETAGYEPESRFNAMHGDRRMIFRGRAGKVDLFIDEFAMCHRLDLRSRLDLESPSVPAGDLLLTKLQVVELTRKDAQDIDALLRDHELGEGHGDHIDVEHLCSLVRDDWGLWRTITGTLGRVVDDAEPEVAARAAELRERLDETGKSRRFRLRARIGEKRRWHEVPEETPG